MFPSEKTIPTAAARLLAPATLLPSHVQQIETGMNLGDGQPSQYKERGTEEGKGD